MIAGDTLVTVSLAGSLFFSISPQAAKDKVLLYLVLTMAPFAVVAPVLGPLLDRGRRARRSLVIFSALGRGVLCVLLASDLKGFLVFPEAFTVLVLSKLYMVAKSSLVPEMAGGEHALSAANARIALVATASGAMAAVPAAVILKLAGGPWVLRLDIAVFAAASIAAARLPQRRRGRRARPLAHPARAGAGESSQGTPGAPQGAAGTLAWSPQPAPSRAGTAAGPAPVEHGLVAGRFLPPTASTAEAFLAATAMSVLRGTVGFVTFFVAFALRRGHAALWWYGLMLVATSIGSFLGSIAVPYLRRRMIEPRILLSALVFVALMAMIAAAVRGVAIQALLTLAMGFAFATSKPAFDALVQSNIPRLAQGRAFARFETRFQLLWVVGGLIPVVAVIPLPDGDIIIAAVILVAALSYVTGRRALLHHARRMQPERGTGM